MKSEGPRARTLTGSTSGVLAILVGLPLTFLASPLSEAADALPNACPVDGCEVKIVAVEKDGDELRLTFEANYTPDMSRNHIHVWWGENYKVEQVSNNAEPVHHVKQGDWHPTAEYPTYVTQSAVSTSVRGSAKTICVSAGDRNHDIIDVTKYSCTDVSAHL
jgi:hypothetical protein